MTPAFRTTWLLLIAFLLAAPAQAGIVFSESDDGPFSLDNLNPTVLPTLEAGDNLISGTVRDTDLDIDFWTFVVPAGFELTGWVVADYQRGDSQGFLGLNDGATFPFPFLQFGVDESAYLGGSAYGRVNVGNDILANIGSVTGRGFTGPLPSGTYTTLVQQTGSAETDYVFNLQVTAVPEPSTFTGVSGLAIAAVLLRRRSRRQISI